MQLQQSVLPLLLVIFIYYPGHLMQGSLTFYHSFSKQNTETLNWFLQSTVYLVQQVNISRLGCLMSLAKVNQTETVQILALLKSYCVPV